MAAGKRINLGITTSDIRNAPMCTICFEPAIPNNVIALTKLKCGHTFHLTCIGCEFNVKGVMQCPNCRDSEESLWMYCMGNPNSNMQMVVDDDSTTDDDDEEGAVDQLFRQCTSENCNCTFHHQAAQLLNIRRPPSQAQVNGGASGGTAANVGGTAANVGGASSSRAPRHLPSSTPARPVRPPAPATRAAAPPLARALALALRARLTNPARVPAPRAAPTPTARATPAPTPPICVRTPFGWTYNNINIVNNDDPYLLNIARRMRRRLLSGNRDITEEADDHDHQFDGAESWGVRATNDHQNQQNRGVVTSFGKRPGGQQPPPPPARRGTTVQLNTTVRPGPILPGEMTILGLPPRPALFTPGEEPGWDLMAAVAAATSATAATASSAAASDELDMNYPPAPAYLDRPGSPLFPLFGDSSLGPTDDDCLDLNESPRLRAASARNGPPMRLYGQQFGRR